MICEKCSSPNAADARFCNKCGATLSPNNVQSPAPLPVADPMKSSGIDGKIAALVIWAVSSLGVYIVLTTWSKYSASCVAGSSCGPFWATLMLLASVGGFGLGVRLWNRG